MYHALLRYRDNRFGEAVIYRLTIDMDLRRCRRSCGTCNRLLYDRCFRMF